MSPKRGAYSRDFREAAIRMLREGREFGELAHELGVTSTTLRVWLHVADGKSHRTDRSREWVISLTSQAYERLDRVLRSRPRSALDAPMSSSPDFSGPWLVKDSVAHVAHHKGRVAHRLTRSRPESSAAERALREYWDPESWAELEASDKVLRTLARRLVAVMA